MSLVDDDRLQAISYARLVHPIAPYAIVTNGAEARLFDSVTRQELRAEEIRLDGDFEIALPCGSDFSALDCFLRLTPGNLLKFCKAQVDINTRALVSSGEDLSRKFIPQLHQPRAELRAAIDTLLASEEPVMFVVGEAGIGKTCCMCYRAQEALAMNRPALFFRGSELESRFVDRLAAEFAWTFSEHLTTDALVRRLSGVVGENALLIFLDALDEWQAVDAREQLGQLAIHLRGLPVKILISCKPYTWSRLVKNRGVPTDLALATARHEDSDAAFLGPLGEADFYEAMGSYRRVFGFSGVWDRALLEQARRSPFFMRIAYEVAQYHRLKDLRESTPGIFEGYYQKLLELTGAPELSERLLTAVARLLFQTNQDQLDLATLSDALGLNVIEQFPEDLFIVGVLEKISQTVSGRPDSVRFTFDGLRNYVIASRVFRWSSMSLEQFSLAARCLSDGGVREEALIGYYRMAPSQHQRVLDRDLFDRAGLFLGTYRKIIEENFSAFADAFPPGDMANACLIVEANLRTSEAHAYGIRRREVDEPPILILPTASAGRDWVDNGLARFGAGGLSFSITQDILSRENVFRELLDSNIGRLVLGAVRKGMLNESSTPDLALELVTGILLSKPEILAEPDRRPGVPVFPLSIGRVKYWALLQQHWQRCHRTLIDEKVSCGDIAVHRSGSVIGYDVPTLSEAERRGIRAQCDRLIAAGVSPGPPAYSPVDEQVGALLRACRHFSDDLVVEGPPYEDLLRSLRKVCERARYVQVSTNEPEVAAECAQFLRAFLSNYERLVALNFPTLKNSFELYSKMPVLVRVAVVQYPWNTENGPSLVSDWLTPEGWALETSRVEPVDIKVLNDAFPWRSRGLVAIEGRTCRWLSRQSGFVNALMGWGGRHYSEAGLGARATPLRDYTYHQVERDLLGVGSALGERYGVEGFQFRR